MFFVCLFFLWTNYYFVIESIHAFYFVSNVVVYKALMIQGKGGSLVYKNCRCNIYAFVSNLTTLTLSNVMDQHLLGGLMNWARRGGLAQAGNRVQRWWGVQRCEDTMGDYQRDNYCQHLSKIFDILKLYIKEMLYIYIKLFLHKSHSVLGKFEENQKC